MATVLVLFAHGPSRAAADTPYSPGWKYRTYKEQIEVHKDGSTTRKYERAYTVLAESALESMSEETVSYHDRDETLEDVVAYTLKQDGRRIDVPDGNVQVTSHDGINGAGPAFSDYKDRHIVFPDVTVGDTVVLGYTIRQRTPTFHGRYSLLSHYSDAYAYDDAELVIRAPKAFGLQQKTYNLDAPVVSEPDKDTRQWTWHYRNAQPRDRRGETNVYERAWRYADWPTIEVSNFRDYGQIAAAYEEEAAKHAAITERIRALSGEIATGATTPRAKAQKIYDWVAKNISFAGNCLTGGDVVPRTTDAVLDMKMGDCKDHATLMQALLAAQGIKSTQALVNSGSWYETPEVPCWQAFDHVINYLPEFDVYLDATSTSSPFGSVPEQELGKPVIRTAAYRGVERIPMRSPEATWSKSDDKVTIQPDGSVDVQSTYEVGGAWANALSKRFGEWKKSPGFDGGAIHFKHWIEQLGYKGSGAYDRIADADGPADRFAYTMHYHIDGYIDTGNPYGLPLAALFPNGNPIAAGGALAAVDSFEHDFLCHGDTKTEELSIAFPANVTLLAVPKDVHVQTALVRFDANYERNGNTIRVKRSVVDSTLGPVCKPEVVTQYARIAAAIKKDAKMQAVYRPNE